MRIKKLSIQNHSRIADTQIEVRDHLVLVGPNDVGKSSIVRCLDLLLGSPTARLYAQIDISDLRDPKEPFIVEAELVDFDELEEALFPDEIDVDPASGDGTLTVRLIASFDEDESLEIERIAPGGGTGRQITRDQLAGLGWKMLGAVAGSRDIREDRKSPLDDILSAVDLSAEKSDFDSVHEKFQDVLDSSDALTGLREELAEQLSKALPVALASKDLAFVSGATAEDEVLNDVRLSVSRSGSKRSITEQSDGTRALFAIALYDLVSASANMVGIDEPEIHLHPTSQRSLARLLRDGSNQKIIATHSTSVVGVFPPEQVVSVKPGGEVVQPHLNFLDADERMALRWWMQDRLEPLTSNHVIAVEGISDRIIVERAAELAGKDLDRLGISLVVTDGSGNMGAIAKLFGDRGFDIATSMLIDEDAVSETASKLGVSEADLRSGSTWVSDSDLEDEYVSAMGAAKAWDALSNSTLFSINELANCNKTGPGGSRCEDDVAQFCRSKSKNKVRAAMVIAPQLTLEIAARITSVQGLLTQFDEA